MNKKNKANQTAQLALLIATMVVIEVLSQTIFAAFVLPIKPTLTHIPVIIAVSSMVLKLEPIWVVSWEL